MSNFKVVCVSDFTERDDSVYGVIYPVAKEIYTIRAIEIESDGTYLLLEEILNPSFQYSDSFGEANFWIEKFRPLNHAFGEETAKRIAEEVREESLTLAN